MVKGRLPTAIGAWIERRMWVQPTTPRASLPTHRCESAPNKLWPLSLLALYVGQRLSISRADFLTTLCSHLDVICCCYFLV